MENDPNTTLEEKLIDVADVILIIMVGAALLTTAFIFLVQGHKNPTVTQGNQSATTSQEIAVIPAKPDPYASLSLEAKAVYVYDVANQKVLFEKNSRQVLPLASLTKMMTALVALDTVPKNTEVTISADALKSDGDTGLTVGERWSFKNLLDFTLIVSSNDGASALASATAALSVVGQTEGDRASTFIDKMNAKAAALGLKTLHFENETGLDLPDGGTGGVGSAQDAAALMEYIISKSPEALEATRNARLSVASESLIHDAVNTNTILRTIPGILASKTGFSDLAGGNLAVAYDVGLQQPIVIVVLGSSYDGRFADMKSLISATEETITGGSTE